mmetsp:Transcript_26100/g.76543  ORF Transcript_26100/g.76543 Transcript_26100/m.76543 type:complete len:253 (+) Transcript_26100:660-1418(+)
MVSCWPSRRPSSLRMGRPGPRGESIRVQLTRQRQAEASDRRQICHANDGGAQIDAWRCALVYERDAFCKYRAALDTPPPAAARTVPLDQYVATLGEIREKTEKTARSKLAAVEALAVSESTRGISANAEKAAAEKAQKVAEQGMRATQRAHTRRRLPTSGRASSSSSATRNGRRSGRTRRTWIRRPRWGASARRPRRRRKRPTRRRRPPRRRPRPSASRRSRRVWTSSPHKCSAPRAGATRRARAARTRGAT